MELPLRCVAVEVREPANSSSTSWLEYCRARDLSHVYGGRGDEKRRLVGSCCVCPEGVGLMRIERTHRGEALGSASR